MHAQTSSPVQSQGLSASSLLQAKRTRSWFLEVHPQAIPHHDVWYGCLYVRRNVQVGDNGVVLQRCGCDVSVVGDETVWKTMIKEEPIGVLTDDDNMLVASPDPVLLALCALVRRCQVTASLPKADVVDEESPVGSPGYVWQTEAQPLLIKTGKASLAVKKLTIEGRNTLSAENFLRGNP
jgi:hypothetical protein